MEEEWWVAVCLSERLDEDEIQERIGTPWLWVRNIGLQAVPAMRGWE